jgi:aromatic-L-amino-acid decarboxylase
MDSEEFRRAGHALIDWIADYRERVETLPVQARVEPGSVREQLPAAPPEFPEPFDAILADLDRVVLPGVTHWQSPSFFAYFPANASLPSVLGELASAGLGVQGMLWATSPACTELETHVLDWVVDLLDLPAAFRGNGVIQDSASSATLCALLAARERAGATGDLSVYASTQAHSSVEKGLRVAGFPTSALRLIDVDATYALRPDVLARLVAEDRAAGRRPCAVVATVGTTSSTAIDPLPAVGELCERENLWLHVDAAYAGSAAVCPELRRLHDGLEFADSYVVDAHKWLLTNFDCSCFYVSDRGPLLRALSILPEYLRHAQTGTGAVIDYRDWHVPLGRRFRALKLWFVLRTYGREGLQAHIRHGVTLAQEFATWVNESPDWEVVAPVPLSLVCFRHTSDDATNEAILNTVNQSGTAYLSHTKLNGQYVLRLAIGAPETRLEHVAAAWDALNKAAARATKGGCGDGRREPAPPT